MGLDMYLKVSKWFGDYDFKPEEQQIAKQIRSAFFPEYAAVEENCSVTLEMQVAYWRKANAIHAFFVDLSGREDDCQPIPVSKESLEDLVGRCKAVLKDPAKADDLLPTRGGFFFGSTDYDEGYFYDLRSTVEQLERVIAALKDTDYCVYEASW